ncbi:MAG: PHB depolymerase family esterase [Burkholderiales bacterium]|nr:PHB depolymerase family esterase [Burkholderiales bacterium]
MSGWWQRLKDRLAGWFRREPAPGHYESGSKFSVRGWVATAPMVWPSREYLVYVPKGRSRWKRAPLLVLCHGCKQTPEDIARGTRVEALADRMGCVVLLPRQKDSANPWRCWNWFEQRTGDGNGEAAIVAAQIRRVRRAYRIDRKRVLAAGMSAGGALAAILGVRYPHLVTAVAVHSGLAAGAARSAMTALSVMTHGPDRDVERIAEEARARAAPHDVRVPLLAIHGERDDVVRPVNAVALVRQYLALNAHPAIAGQPHGTPALPDPDREAAIRTPEGRTQMVRDWYRDGRLVARHVEVTDLGHAWSGGDTALVYNDAAAPDAMALVGAFIEDALSSR